GANLESDRAVFCHVGSDDHRVRARLERLEHWHGRADAVEPRDVAAGEHDAAMSAADDHRPVEQLWMVSLLDRRIEGVAIDVGEGEFGELGVLDKTRRSALDAAPLGWWFR